MSTKANTYIALLHHAWLGFRRSHHFERSLGTKFILAFVALTLMMYMLALGIALPGLLNHFFPEQTVVDSFLSLLILIYAGDFMLRFFMQKVPAQQVQAYLHLPVNRNKLTNVMLTKSWFSIYNVYLFPMLVPFFMRTLLAGGEVRAFWLLLAGCFLLGSINHALIILLKTRSSNTWYLPILLILAGALLSAGFFFSRDLFFSVSELIGKSFLHGNPWVFILSIALIIGFQIISSKSLITSLYRLNEGAASKKAAASSRIEAFFQKIPEYGRYLVLEWRLLNRNKRASRGFRQWPLMLVFVPFFIYYGRDDLLHNYMIFFLMFAGGYGFFHLQYAYSWESRFFDFIASKKMDMQKMIVSRYYFYLFLAILQTIILSPVLYVIRPDAVLPFIAMMLYVTGPVFALLLYMGISYSTRIDPDKKAFFNTEGISGVQFLFIILVMLSYIPFTIIAFILPFDFLLSLSVILGITGLFVILTNRLWVKRIAQKFMRRKYIQLAKYREK